LAAGLCPVSLAVHSAPPGPSLAGFKRWIAPEEGRAVERGEGKE